MRVAFPRLTDGAESYVVVHRDDGAIYRVRGNGQRSGPELSHDLAHFVVERALGLTGGSWGGVAGDPGEELALTWPARQRAAAQPARQRATAQRAATRSAASRTS